MIVAHRSSWVGNLNLLELCKLYFLSLLLMNLLLFLLSIFVSLIFLDDLLDVLLSIFELHFSNFPLLFNLCIKAYLDLSVPLSAQLHDLALSLSSLFVLLKLITKNLSIKLTFCSITLFDNITHPVHNLLNSLMPISFLFSSLFIFKVHPPIILLHQLYLLLLFNFEFSHPPLLLNLIGFNNLLVALSFLDLLSYLVVLFLLDVLLELLDLNDLLGSEILELFELLFLCFKQHHVSLGLLQFDFHHVFLLLFLFFFDFAAGVFEHDLVHLLVVLDDVLLFLSLLLELLVESAADHVAFLLLVFFCLFLFLFVFHEIVVVNLGPLIIINITGKTLVIYFLTSHVTVLIWNLLFAHLEADVSIVLVFGETLATMGFVLDCASLPLHQIAELAAFRFFGTVSLFKEVIYFLSLQ